MLPIVVTVVVLFMATLMHAALGFGTALVAMPLLVLVLGLETAVPLVALSGLTTIAVLLLRGWRHIDVRAAARLLLGSTIGIPIGLVLLRTAPEFLVKSFLGVTLIAYGLYNLKRPVLPTLEAGPSAYAFGFIAGILGGAYNTNGPPLVIYGALRRWPAEQFRATLQGYFLPTAMLICIAHAAAGLWSVEVFTLFGFALPLVLAAIPLGLWLGRRIPAERFTKGLYAVLVVLGALLLV